MLCGFSSLWWPFGWKWSYLGFLGIICRTFGSKCRGRRRHISDCWRRVLSSFTFFNPPLHSGVIILNSWDILEIDSMSCRWVSNQRPIIAANIVETDKLCNDRSRTNNSQPHPFSVCYPLAFESYKYWACEWCPWIQNNMIFQGTFHHGLYVSDILWYTVTMSWVSSPWSSTLFKIRNNNDAMYAITSVSYATLQFHV